MHSEKIAAGTFSRQQSFPLGSCIFYLPPFGTAKYQAARQGLPGMFAYARRFLSRRILSAIIAMNSLLVGLPRRL